ncbi:hypothetical protein BDV96DRAFT_76697 [Lophiotrema nucula]|uniref:DUF7730 domain-containing protein n=1 Tax=Lophiotrema nucula TaxID=690887 RepID=A0A6A5Z851_9PLEO|nr:hypothetical protein BDV96DRAFT_76697 [Lophiotrema nucula]
MPCVTRFTTHNRKYQHTRLTRQPKPLASSLRCPKRTRASRDAARPTQEPGLSIRTVAEARHTPKNPQACLLGLPTELRLQIYEYLFESVLIHLHRRYEPNGNATLTWTSCSQTSERSSLLCANPKWSGLCEDERRCEYRSDALPESSCMAFMWTCKLIYIEASPTARSRAALSIPEEMFYEFRCYSPPKLLEKVTRLALTGPYDDFGHKGWAPYINLSAWLPQLKEVAFQGQVARAMLQDEYGEYVPEQKFRDWFLFKLFAKRFSPQVAITFDGLSLTREDELLPKAGNADEMVRFRVVRRGKEVDEKIMDDEWRDEDIEILSERSSLQESGRDAGWRVWWNKPDTKDL